MSETDSEPAPTPQTGGVREVKSAGRTVELLEVLAERGDRPARVRTAADAYHRAALAAALAAIRERGCAVDREEGVSGIAGFGFALRHDAPATDAIS